MITSPIVILLCLFLTQQPILANIEHNKMFGSSIEKPIIFM